MANKIKYGICNCYYAMLGAEGYGTPKALPGAVSISLDPQGDMYTFYADNIAYYKNAVNNGYEGDLELALLPDDFLTDVLGNEVVENDNVMVEKVQTTSPIFALGFQLEGDEKASRFWFYNCTATRPTTSGQTKEESIEAQTETITISNSPTAEGVVRARTTDTTPTNTYSGWFSSVWTQASEG